MFLYLVQHAEARCQEEDPARDLTEKGRQDIEEVAHHLKRLQVQVEQIFHSSKTRAQSTAKVLASHLQPPAGASAAPGLAPLDDPAIWAARLAAMEDNVLLVGHLPHLGKLAGLLVSGDQEKKVADFQMGGAVRLKRLKVGHWAVDWIITPGIIL